MFQRDCEELCQHKMKDNCENVLSVEYQDEMEEDFVELNEGNRNAEEIEEANGQEIPCVPEAPEVPSDPPEISPPDFDNIKFYLGKNRETRWYLKQKVP